MLKWRDFLDGVEKREDLESLVEELSEDIKLIKPRTMNEEVRLSTIDGLMTKILKEARRLSRKNEILQKKISILEEDKDL
jgi:hypothetical protein|tara:strand:+ start:127 stop:366 length:240 start_codon:yes stop_codon:yes gene_type:complete